MICAATLWSTIVVLRDGRRSRSWRADVAQLVAHHLAKVRVAGSNPVIRSKVVASTQRWSGRVVRQRPAKPCTRVRFPSPPQTGAISSVGERFPDTEEVTGSIPVSRTRVSAGQRRFLRCERAGAPSARPTPLPTVRRCKRNEFRSGISSNRVMRWKPRSLPVAVRSSHQHSGPAVRTRHCPSASRRLRNATAPDSRFSRHCVTQRTDTAIAARCETLRTSYGELV